jgi:hypothetical protein
MKKIGLLFLLIPSLFFISFNANAKENGTATLETIILIRHGEKPLDKEIGQLNCKGLNRSLKLPKVLVSKFGKPDYIFAPNPSDQIGKKDQKYSYNRPLATIEPTAIQLGMPVNAQFGFNSINEVSNEFLSSKYKNSVIFVSWEHNKLLKIVQDIYSKDKNNSSDNIPDWPSSDYDSIYILKISRENNSTKITFSQDKEELNEQSETCPFPIE